MGGGNARRFANEWAGQFSADVRWERIWEGYLYEMNHWTSEDLNSPPAGRIRQTHCSFHPSTPRSPSLIASLPAEILRSIFHIAAQSLLPPETAPIHNRRIQHRQRARFLLSASLVCRAWRSEAQSELVSFAYCTNRVNLDRLINFLSKRKRAKQVRRFRLDLPEEEETDPWMSTLRLSELFPHLPSVDIGGKICNYGVVLNLGGAVPKVSSVAQELMSPRAQPHGPHSNSRT